MKEDFITPEITLQYIPLRLGVAGISGGHPLLGLQSEWVYAG